MSNTLLWLLGLLDERNSRTGKTENGALQTPGRAGVVDLRKIYFYGNIHRIGVFLCLGPYFYVWVHFYAFECISMVQQAGMYFYGNNNNLGYISMYNRLGYVSIVTTGWGMFL